jgi:ABC-type branched-subunit amino acid transport system ATPase component
MSGSVYLAGQDISGPSENLRAPRGLGYVPQSRDVFPTLTVTETLEMDGYRLGSREVQARPAECSSRARPLSSIQPDDEGVP